ncbi:MAG: Hpt domain-containing protein [Lachnospiraceae bacterium]|nr:Hpt domain-containing protein [Lachnospiraceae bacterium]
MTEQLLIQLAAQGNRIQEMVDRFAGNEAICVKLVKKFPADQNYAAYKTQIAQADLKAAEQSVHTLKGVSSNLGLTNISDLTQKIVDEIRGEQDMEKLQGWTAELEVVYEKAVAVIQQFMD